MGNLRDDTAVDGENGRYKAVLSEDWRIWGPNGGYVASVALRAAGRHTGIDGARPVSLTCQFLRPARFDAVDIEVTTLRRTRRAEAMRVELTQGGEPVLEAQVWAVGANEGLEHDHAPPPEVPAPEDTPTPLERFAAAGIEPPEPPYVFWNNFDDRPIDWIDDWENRTPGKPETRGWYRFVPEATFDEVWLDACRGLILVDTFTWPAAVRAHTGVLPWMAPSLDLAVQFHHDPAGEEWLLVQGTARVAQRGTIGCENHVWARDGRLVASGSGSLLCTPVPTA